MGELNGEAAEACFLSSAFVGLIHMALYQSEAGQKSARAMLVGLAGLWRGAACVSRAFTSSHANASIAKQIWPVPSPSGSMTRHVSDYTIMSQRLKIHIESLLDEAQRRDQNGVPPRRHMLLIAADDLEAAVDEYKSRTSTSGILSWFSCPNAGILELFSARYGGNMVSEMAQMVHLLAAFYGVALNLLKTTWYIGDLGRRLVQEATSFVSTTDLEAVRLMNWAREEVCNQAVEWQVQRIFSGGHAPSVAAISK
ncbi:hypothetical protein Slin15195_G091050 [Septoria linicola]|uniref:Uncharacterized protein n=1 Tax=Septoria linicola TaxID=215465 RepID=A0A9Q9ELH6_9PEZI|nr:hypothetical protein Slin15195_G091050 [Septoria linicola]